MKAVIRRSDWKVDLTKPFDGLIGERKSFAFCRCDGSAQEYMKADLTDEQMKALVTKAGGEVGP